MVLNMIQRGIATFGLDFGKCPSWLFERMVKLGREMTLAIVAEEGPNEFIRRLADPAWFQALGTVLAFDWNASGLTTILTAAIRREETDLGLFICGGKGKTSRKTPDEIFGWGEKMNFAPSKTENLIYNSKMAAKVDSALIQDGFQIYHHTFFFTRNGAWTVVQQGMNNQNQTARRYHWHSRDVKDLVCEPHSAISSQARSSNVLDLTAQTSTKNREVSAELILTGGFNALMKDLVLLGKYMKNPPPSALPLWKRGRVGVRDSHFSPLSQMIEISDKTGQQRLKFLNLETVEFRRHPVVTEDFSKSKYLQKILWRLCDQKPKNYEKLLAKDGVGPKTIRALTLVAEVLYGAKPSYKDPARYSFAHGGKDNTPYPIDRTTYNKTIETMREYVKKSRIPTSDKDRALKRLSPENRNNLLF